MPARFAGWSLTFLAVVVGWVFFRAPDIEAAFRILAGMAGFSGVALPNAIAARLGEMWSVLSGLGVSTFLGGGSEFLQTWIWIVVLMPVALFMPNTQQIMQTAEPTLNSHHCSPADELPMPGSLARLKWRATSAWAAATGILAAAAVMAMTRVSEFLYFQF